MQTISVIVEHRPDGGIQVRSDDLPGLILSGSDRMRILASILPAAKALLQHRGDTDLDVRINAAFVGGDSSNSITETKS